MNSHNNSDYGTLVLRLALGIMFVAHGYLKIAVFTVAGTVGFFESLGLPGFLAYIVIAAEIGGGLLLIAGFMARWVALAMIPILLGALGVHGGNGWLFSAPNGGWEYPAFLAAAALAVGLLGNGAFALQYRKGRGLHFANAKF